MDEIDDIDEKLKYYTIIYERAVVALSLYESQPNIDKTVVDFQRHRVEVSKRQLDAFKKENNR